MDSIPTEKDIQVSQEIRQLPVPSNNALTEDEVNLVACSSSSSSSSSTSNPHKQQQETVIPPELTKSQLKKLAKKEYFESTRLQRRQAEKQRRKQRKREKWLLEQQQQNEENNKRKHQEETNDHVSDQQQQEETCQPAVSKRPKRTKNPFKAKLVIDLGFDDLMTDREISSLGQQLMYLYSSNCKSGRPFEEIIVTGKGRQDMMNYLSPDQHSLVPFPSKTDQEDDEIFNEMVKGSSHDDENEQEPCIFTSESGKNMETKLEGVWRRWKRITVYERGGLERLIKKSDSSTSAEEMLESHDDLISATAASNSNNRNKRVEQQAAGRILSQDVIYLTADTEDTITELEEGKTYVIGGIVDHNRYKNLCLTKAQKIGVRVARLPLTTEILDQLEQRLSKQGETAMGSFSGRKVLTVNQVVNILLGWTKSETGDWVDAVANGLPRRKFDPRLSVSSSTATATATATTTTATSIPKQLEMTLPLQQQQQDSLPSSLSMENVKETSE